jgi:hypothetical protein
MKYFFNLFILLIIFFPQAGIFPFENISGDSAVITKSNYHFGNIEIQIKQVLGSECSAWVEIIKEGRILHKKEFINIEGLGKSYGLYVPAKQPDNKYFIINKYGDYDGRTLLIDRNGKLIDLPGGHYFITKDKHYLFINHEIDGFGSITVFDLHLGKVIYGNIPDEAFNMVYGSPESIKYSQINNDVYVIFGYTDDADKIYKYDFKINHLMLDKKIKIYPRDKFDLYPAPDSVKNCTCTKNDN